MLWSTEYPHAILKHALYPKKSFNRKEQSTKALHLDVSEEEIMSKGIFPSIPSDLILSICFRDGVKD